MNLDNFIKECKEQPVSLALQKTVSLGNGSYKILCETTVLSGICGRICPHNKQCQGSCVRGIKGEPVSIGNLEAFVFDKVLEDENSLLNCYNEGMQENKAYRNKKVAVIGGGPAGLTCSAFLAKNGIDVTIFEKYNYLGGLLVHGIPEFRLPKTIVNETINKILKLGIKVEYNKELGKDINLEKLVESYDAIFLGIGANVSSKMWVQGEELKGVYGGIGVLLSNHNLIFADANTSSILVVTWQSAE